MTKIEKVIIGIIVACLIVMVISVKSCIGAIDESGGFKNIIVEAGKEIKDISHEINKE